MTYALPDGMTNRGRLSMTANKGAAEIRHKILRRMNDLEADGSASESYLTKWEALRAYIKGMAKRASKKSGGLGRK